MPQSVQRFILAISTNFVNNFTCINIDITRFNLLQIELQHFVGALNSFKSLHQRYLGRITHKSLADSTISRPAATLPNSENLIQIIRFHLLMSIQKLEDFPLMFTINEELVIFLICNPEVVDFFPDFANLRKR